MAEKGATQPGVQGEDQESSAAAELQTQATKERQPTERELEMERIAAGRKEFVQNEIAELDPPKEDLPKEELKASPEKTAAAELDPHSQLLRQLEDGNYLIDEALMDRAFVRSKVDGREELVPAKKALGQYQKSAAADLRLAEATRLRSEAQELLKHNARPADADTSTQQADVKEIAAKAAAKFKEASTALYEGDADKASVLFAEATTIAQTSAAGRTDPVATPKEEDIVERVEQRLSVKSALTQLFTDYPEINSDADMAVLADSYRARFEGEGLSRAEAITKAGESIGQKFKLGKHAPQEQAADPAANPGRPTNQLSTTRAEKLAAKERLDEPKAASARASVAPVQVSSEDNRSATIAEMSAGRLGGRV